MIMVLKRRLLYVILSVDKRTQRQVLEVSVEMEYFGLNASY